MSNYSNRAWLDLIRRFFYFTNTSARPLESGLYAGGHSVSKAPGFKELSYVINRLKILDHSKADEDHQLWQTTSGGTYQVHVFIYLMNQREFERIPFKRRDSHQQKVMVATKIKEVRKYLFKRTKGKIALLRGHCSL